MDEEMALRIKAYDEFTAVMGQFSGSLEGVERASVALVAATKSLNQTVLLFLDAVQKTGPPTKQRSTDLAQEGAAATATTAAERELVVALEKGAQAEKATATATKTNTQATETSTTAKRNRTRVLTEEEKAAKAAKEAERQHTDELKRQAQAQKQAEQATKAHKEKVDDLVQALGAMGILSAVKRGLTDVTATGVAFNRELTIQRGLTGQSVDTSKAFLMSLEDQKKSVTELATGLNELGRAGYEGAQGMQALPELATFSRAAIMDLEKAMSPVVTILKVFEKNVKDTGEITDVLTTSANRSALGFDDFQLGLAMSAGVAKLANQDYRELVTVLSVLRDAGLGASDAGTSIKSAWMALMNPTTEAQRVMKDLGIQVYDAQGRMKSWADIVASAETALKPLNDQSRNLALTTIFGSDGVRAMALSMGRGSEYIRGMTKDLQESRGATAALAHEMDGDFKGAMDRTQANLEKMRIMVFDDLKGAFSSALGALDTLVVGFNSLDGAGRALIEILVGGMGVVGALGAVALLVKTTVIPLITGLKALFTLTTAEIAAAGGALAVLTNPAVLATAAVLALGVAWISYTGAQEKARQEAERKGQTLLTLHGEYERLSQVMSESTTKEEAHTRAAEEQRKVIKQIGELFPELVKRWDEHGNAVELNTEKVKANTKAIEDNDRAKTTSALKAAKADVDAANRNIEFLEKRRRELDGAQGFAVAGMKQGIDQKIAEQRRNREAATSEWLKAYTILYGEGDIYGPIPDIPASGPAGGKQYDPDAAKRVDEAEKARIAAIRDQMDLMRHLVAMDDSRVDTAQEQLTWLERIRATLGTTRDLDEAIHKLESEIVRQPLAEQIAAFERRKQLGEVTARQEQQFYEGLVANAEALHLTEKERLEYQVQGALAKRAADKETFDQLISNYHYQVDMTDASTKQQLEALRVIRDQFATDAKEKRQLNLEVHRLEKQLQQETHDSKLAEVEFDAIVHRWTNDQKLAALKAYLATAKDLTAAQQRELQKTVASMETQSQESRQNKLLGLLREGYETERKIRERQLRDEQDKETAAKEKAIKDATKHYEDALSPLKSQLETMQDQTRELERQKRLLEMQKALREKDQEITDAKAIKNRVVVESGGLLGFRLRRTYDEAKVRELEKDRAKLAADLADEQAKQQRERDQEAVQDRIKALETERDARLKALNTELSDMRREHAKQLTDLGNYFDDRLSAQNLKLELERSGWQTHFDTLYAKSQEFYNKQKALWADLQKPSITNGASLAQKLGAPAGAIAGSSAAASSMVPMAAPATPALAQIAVNQYGDHHYDGITGVTEAVDALVAGAKARLKK